MNQTKLIELHAALANVLADLLVLNNGELFMPNVVAEQVLPITNDLEKVAAEDFDNRIEHIVMQYNAMLNVFQNDMQQCKRGFWIPIIVSDALRQHLPQILANRLI